FVSFFLLKNLLRMNADPPLEVAPAAISVMFAVQTGHVALASFLSFQWVSWFFPNRHKGDRAIPPKICDIPPPIARPVSAAWDLAAFRARVRNDDAGAAPLFPARANVLRQPAMTSRAAERGR